MKSNKYEIKYRQHLANQRRLEEVEEMLKKLPLKPLPEPIQKGWNVYYDLRDDIKNREDAFVIQQAVDIGYAPYQTITSLKHVKMIRGGKKGYVVTLKGKKIWISFCPSKTSVSEKEYEAMSPQLRKYFYLDTLSERYIKFGRKYYMIDIPDYYLILKCRAIIHTHYREKGGKLEKERDFLQDEINRYWRLSTGGYSTSFPARKERVGLRDKIQKFLKGEIEDIPNEKIPKMYDY